ncbi:MAG: hypothetical protein ABL986_02950 [Vicinamibacterales bacterium]
MRHPIPFMTGLMILSLVTAGAAQDKTKAQDKAVKRAPLTLALSTNVAPAPAQVTARISVEPDARSRSLTVEWWSEDGAGGSHGVSLDGERAAARQDFSIKRMEAGTYIVRAVLVRDDGSIVKKESNLVVVGEGSRFRADQGANLILEPPTTNRR